MLPLSYVINVRRKAREPSAGDGRTSPVERSAAIWGHHLRRATPPASSVRRWGARQAQPAQALVGNLGQAGSEDAVHWDRAQSCTTGSDATGYTLTSIQARIEETANLTGYAPQRVWNRDEGDRPNPSGEGALEESNKVTYIMRLNISIARLYRGRLLRIGLR